jgi:choline-sulfatase
MADQLAARALPAYGSTIARTPHLDALAAEGVVFENAYCNSPLCAPSRASMLTGRLPSAVAVYDNGAELGATVPTLAHHLRARGYLTCAAGKLHFVGPDQLHGFEERLTTDVYPAGSDWIPDWGRPLDERLPWYHDLSSVLDAGVSEATLQLDYDEEVGFRSVRKLYDLARAADDRPFFLLVSFTHPHDPFEVPRAYWDRHEDVDLPRVPALPADQLDPHSRRIRTMLGVDEADVGEEAIRRARRAYYGAVSYVDDKLGELIGALELTGLRERTIVLFASDHGEALGERGLWYKMTFFEESMRVPLLFHAPGRFEPARVSDNVSLLDLAPTLIELAGGSDGAAEGLEGASLLPLLDAGTRPPGTVAAEYLAEGAVAPCVMLRRGDLKYVRSASDPDRLYDLARDPLELADLAPRGHHELASLAAEVERRWNLDRLHDEVVASQRRRLVVARALAAGRPTRWDYTPPEDSGERYVRGADFWRPFERARLRP